MTLDELNRADAEDSDDLGGPYLARRDRAEIEDVIERARRRVGMPAADAGARAAGAVSPVIGAGGAAAPPAVDGDVPGEGITAADVARDVGEGILESPVQITGGVRDAAQNSVVAAINAVGDFLEERFPLGSLNLDTLEFEAGARPIELPEVPAADSFTGGAIRGMAQFLAGFVPAARVAGLAGAATTAGKVARAAGAGAAADFAVFSGQEGRLSDLWRNLKLPENLLTEYLASKPDDSEIEGRVKNAIEGLGLGVLAEGLFLGIRAVRAGVIARRQQAAAQAQPAGAPAAPAAVEPGVDERDFLMLGGADDARVVVTDDTAERGDELLARQAGRAPATPQETAAADALRGELRRVADDPIAAPFDVVAMSAGGVLPATELAPYVRNVVKTEGAKPDLPRFVFDLGVVPEGVIADAAAGRAEFGALTGRRVVISNHAIDKLHRNSPRVADDILADLPDLLTNRARCCPTTRTPSGCCWCGRSRRPSPAAPGATPWR